MVTLWSLDCTEHYFYTLCTQRQSLAEMLEQQWKRVAKDRNGRMTQAVRLRKRSRRVQACLEDMNAWTQSDIPKKSHGGVESVHYLEVW